MEFSTSLKKNEDFRYVYRNGKVKANRYLVMYIVENNQAINRLGISASKKVGNSVVRHHFYRLVRESYRLHEKIFNSGLDIVVVAKKSAALRGQARRGEPIRRLRAHFYILENCIIYVSEQDNAYSGIYVQKIVINMKNIMISLIKIYRKYLSPLKSTKCPYFPSCSEYGLEAIEKYGALKGGMLALWRILRCNPFSKGGYDPVP